MYSKSTKSLDMAEEQEVGSEPGPGAGLNASCSLRLGQFLLSSIGLDTRSRPSNRPKGQICQNLSHFILVTDLSTQMC